MNNIMDLVVIMATKEANKADIILIILLKIISIIMVVIFTILLKNLSKTEVIAQNLLKIRILSFTNLNKCIMNTCKMERVKKKAAKKVKKIIKVLSFQIPRILRIFSTLFLEGAKVLKRNKNNIQNK